MKKNAHKDRIRVHASQRGATLIVALVLLAVITVIGLASIRSSNLELKMASSARDRAVALDYAESAVDIVRQLLDVRYNLTIDRAQLTSPASIEQQRLASWPQLKSFLPSCGPRNPNARSTGNAINVNCFTENCNSGLCFTGNLAVETKAQCRLENDASGTVMERWREDSVWDDTNRHGVVQLSRPDGSNVDVQYLVEMLCFIPRSDRDIEDPDLVNGVPLYRVTTRAKGDAGRSTVVLQTVYKGNML